MPVSFNGTSGYIGLSNSSLYEPQTFTIAGWFKSNGSTWDDYPAFGSKRGGTNENFGYVFFGVQGNKNVQISFRSAEGNTWRAVSYSAPAGFDIQQWHFYAATYDQAVLKLFVDGVLEGSLSTSDTIAYDSGTGGTLHIARDYSSAFDRYGNIQVGDWSFWNVGLPDDAIRGLMHRRIVPDSRCVTAIRVDEGSGSAVYDVRQFTNGTLYGGYSWVGAHIPRSLTHE